MLILLLFLYTLSIVGACNYLHIAYSKNGIWYCLEGSITETITIAACPIINSFFAIGWLLDKPLKKD